MTTLATWAFTIRGWSARQCQFGAQSHDIGIDLADESARCSRLLLNGVRELQPGAGRRAAENPHAYRYSKIENDNERTQQDDQGRDEPPYDSTGLNPTQHLGCLPVLGYFLHLP
ncbi:MAG: hypothetical protein HYX92_08650 [Chloroflexi bacterium]|nr:hypothetical protein [Chloroflexota bacterium]